MLMPQTATPRSGSLAVEGQLLPLKLSCFLNRAKPYSHLGNVLWCNHGDVGVASAVFSVKGQEVADAVDLHRGDQPCIVCLHAGDRVTDGELSPFLIRGHAIRKEPKVTLDARALRSASEGRRPKPPRAEGGRVYTLQNSARTCGVKQSISLRLRSVLRVSTARV